MKEGHSSQDSTISKPKDNISAYALRFVTIYLSQGEIVINVK
jgi:hypothetical protein